MEDKLRVEFSGYEEYDSSPNKFVCYLEHWELVALAKKKIEKEYDKKGIYDIHDSTIIIEKEIKF